MPRSNELSPYADPDVIKESIGRFSAFLDRVPRMLALGIYDEFVAKRMSGGESTHPRLRSELYMELMTLAACREAAQGIVLRRWLHPTAPPMVTVRYAIKLAALDQRDLVRAWAAASDEFQTLIKNIMVQFDHMNYFYGSGDLPQR